MRPIIVGTILIGLWSAIGASADDVATLCCEPPVCGKVCKLVCDTKKLTAVGYGADCKDICIPEPSRCGCKHYDSTCCCGENQKGCPPKVEFFWRDWFPCGCAQTRTIHVLTKYQAEREIPSYHWQVVDAACGAPVATSQGRLPRPIYKLAPADAEIGDVLQITDEEWPQLAAMLTPVNPATAPAPVAESAPPTAADNPSIADRLRRLLPK